MVQQRSKRCATLWYAAGPGESLMNAYRKFAGIVALGALTCMAGALSPAFAEGHGGGGGHSSSSGGGGAHSHYAAGGHTGGYYGGAHYAGGYGGYHGGAYYG